MSTEDVEKAKIKLITLLNVASARNASKRKFGEDWHEIARRVKKSKELQSKTEAANADKATVKGLVEVAAQDDDEQDASEAEDEDNEDDSHKDPFSVHFATENRLLNDEAIAASKEAKWTPMKHAQSELGQLVEVRLDLPAAVAPDPADKIVMNPRFQEKFEDYKASVGTQLPTELLDILASYKDLLYARTHFDQYSQYRAVMSLHAMNHIAKTRQRVLKNNEALAGGNEAKDRETRDQGFTRPKVLILCPMRNSAVPWIESIMHFSLATQVENKTRFLNDFSLPEGATDKLARTEKDADGNAKYPRDHRENFHGNIDDTFRVGLKVTRKSLKLYSEFYQSDLIIASPLGLRTSIEKQKSADFLSSVEIVIADQMDVMQMQNWEHVQFVFEHLNKIPKEAHGCDFARVKPWYLDGQAAHLRQTICLSQYEFPDLRHLFNKELVNVAGKVRTTQEYEGVLDQILPGVKQTFLRFDPPTAQAEDDARFDYFTKKALPAIRKSAVASAHTIIFIPSYFDFVRVNAHLKTLENFDYAVLSEYSSNSEISRARTNFFNGKKSFLVITERFHFFRRYKIRGAHTVLFYAPPERASFYAEFLQYPFLKRERPAGKGALSEEMVDVALEAEEVFAETIFSKYDFLKLQRIVGTQDARTMCKKEGRESYAFA